MATRAAMEAVGNGEHEKAVAAYSTAFAVIPSALVYAKRAESLLKLGCPQGCRLRPRTASTPTVARHRRWRLDRVGRLRTRACAPTSGSGASLR